MIDEEICYWLVSAIFSVPNDVGFVGRIDLKRNAGKLFCRKGGEYLRLPRRADFSLSTLILSILTKVFEV